MISNSLRFKNAHIRFFSLDIKNSYPYFTELLPSRQM